MSIPTPASTVFPYHLLKWTVVSPLLHTALGLRIYDAGRVPLQGPILLVSNHSSYLDPLVVANCARRPVAFMAKEELFHVPILRQILRLYGAFPVKRGTGDRGALRTAIGALEAGWAVGVFLNGTRTDDGRIHTPQLGAALISARTGIPLLPLAIVGTERILPRGSRVPRLGRLTVRFGTPIPPPVSGAREWIQRTTTECAEQIHGLLDLPP